MSALKILLVMDPAEMREIVQFNLEAKLGVQILSARSEAEAIGILLTDDKLDLIIVDTASGTGQFAKFADDKAGSTPVIEIRGTASALSKSVKVVEEIPKGKLMERLPVVLGTWVVAATQDGKKFKSSAESDLDRGFCRIQTHLLLESSPLKADIYLRLSSRKYLKLFAKGDLFDRVDLERYLRLKKIEFLHLKSEETNEFVKKLGEKLEQMLLDQNLLPEDATEAATVAVETIREVAFTIGITPAVDKVFKVGVAMVMKSMSKNPDISPLVQKMLMDRTRYISAHSVATAQLACALALQLEWKSDTTFQKLTMAAMLHDISLKNEKLCQLRTMDELEALKGQFTAEEYAEFEAHPLKISQLVKTFPDVHADVDLIVLQHHETPSGTGFPKGVNASRISPLACVFIVAHDLADALVEKGPRFNLDAYMESRKEIYATGNFKKALSAIPKAQLTFS